jgi:hypothetical protein
MEEGVADDSEDEDPMSSCRSLDLDQLILDTINNSEARDLEDFDSLSNDDVKNVCADLFRGKDTHKGPVILLDHFASFALFTIPNGFYLI